MAKRTYAFKNQQSRIKRASDFLFPASVSKINTIMRLYKFNGKFKKLLFRT